jgi:hypothetical protein
MLLAYIGQQITIYAGYFLVVAGVVGNGINILVFSTVRNYRTTSCIFYILNASIWNIAFITIDLISRIVMIGYGIDLTRTSISWCKMRLFIGLSITLISLTCSCLSTIDQFFITSQCAYLRRFSNIKWAHRIVLIITIVWWLHAIPVLVFYNISPITKMCVSTSFAYAIYYSIYSVGLFSVIPVLVMAVFGYLTYRNIRLTRVLARQQADRQLTRMILIQLALVVICLVPYGINYTYYLITSNVSKSENRLNIENFVSTVTAVVVYIYFCVCSVNCL